MHEAKKSLAWLRGWTIEQAITDEFWTLQEYDERSKSCELCKKKQKICSHPQSTMFEKLSEFKKKSAQKPFIIVLLLFFISVSTPWFMVSSYWLQILEAYNIPIKVKLAIIVLTTVNLLGNILSLILVRFVSKRKLYLIMMTMTFLSTLILCSYGFLNLPKGYNSTHALYITETIMDWKWIPFTCIISTSFFLYVGVFPMPWQILSVAFPNKYVFYFLTKLNLFYFYT